MSTPTAKTTVPTKAATAASLKLVFEAALKKKNEKTLLEFKSAFFTKNGLALDDSNILTIPIHNKIREVVDATFVDNSEIGQKAFALPWNMSQQKYATGRSGQLSHFIFGKKPDKGKIIDHINNQRNDNRACNLREITTQENTQNKAKKPGSTSEYYGVCLSSNKKQWLAKFCRQNLGGFPLDNELDAAKAYDKAAIAKFGPNVRCNNVLTEAEKMQIVPEIMPLADDVIQDSKTGQTSQIPGLVDKKEILTINDKLITFYERPNNQANIKKEKRDLPVGVYESSHSATRWTSQIRLDKQVNLGTFGSIKEASAAYQKALKEKLDAKRQATLATPIIYNDKQQAVLKGTRNKETVDIIIDEKYFHTLIQYKWWVLDNESIRGEVDKDLTRHGRNHILLTHFLFALEYGIYIPHDEVIDHINRIPLDNQMKNLRQNTKAGNGHNKKVSENALCKHLGVSFQGSLYLARITKDGKTIGLGTFKTENEAADAYNKKAVELYGTMARLNIIV